MTYVHAGGSAQGGGVPQRALLRYGPIFGLQTRLQDVREGGPVGGGAFFGLV